MTPSAGDIVQEALIRVFTIKEFLVIRTGNFY
jgi:hypothetical protein